MSECTASTVNQLASTLEYMSTGCAAIDSLFGRGLSAGGGILEVAGCVCLLTDDMDKNTGWLHCVSIDF
jgi:hypothetical protein